MTKIRLIAISIIVCFSMAYAEDIRNPVEHWAKYPKIAYPKGEKGEAIRRGEYLVMASDCIACHSIDEDHPFAGGWVSQKFLYLVFAFFRNIYSPILRLIKTGIYNWSQKIFQFYQTRGSARW